MDGSRQGQNVVGGRTSTPKKTAAVCPAEAASPRFFAGTRRARWPDRTRAGETGRITTCSKDSKNPAAYQGPAAGLRPGPDISRLQQDNESRIVKRSQACFMFWNKQNPGYHAPTKITTIDTPLDRTLDSDQDGCAADEQQNRFHGTEHNALEEPIISRRGSARKSYFLGGRCWVRQVDWPAQKIGHLSCQAGGPCRACIFDGQTSEEGGRALEHWDRRRCMLDVPTTDGHK